MCSTGGGGEGCVVRERGEEGVFFFSRLHLGKMLYIEYSQILYVMYDTWLGIDFYMQLPLPHPSESASIFDPTWPASGVSFSPFTRFTSTISLNCNDRCTQTK